MVLHLYLQDGILIMVFSFTKAIHQATTPAGKQQLLVKNIYSLITISPHHVDISIGQNNQAGKSILKTDYVENNTIEANLKLSVRVLLKTLDAASPSPERIELSVLRRGPDGRISHTTVSDAEVCI